MWNVGGNNWVVFRQTKPTPPKPRLLELTSQLTSRRLHQNLLTPRPGESKASQNCCSPPPFTFFPSSLFRLHSSCVRLNGKLKTLWISHFHFSSTIDALWFRGTTHCRFGDQPRGALFFCKKSLGSSRSNSTPYGESNILVFEGKGVGRIFGG